MEKIYSNIKPEVLLDFVYRKEDILNQEYRGFDLTDTIEVFQARTLKENKGNLVPPHKHLPQKRTTEYTQEALVLIQGKAKVEFYDLNDEKISETILGEGDCFVGLRGGHSLEVLEDNTLIYEFKNGPYNGKEKDKKFIKK